MHVLYALFSSVSQEVEIRDSDESALAPATAFLCGLLYCLRWKITLSTLRPLLEE